MYKIIINRCVLSLNYEFAGYLLVLAGYHLSGRVSGSGEKIYKVGKYIGINIDTTLHT